MLHITNGNSAASAIRETGISGDVLPWDDVLHEGPVPAGLSLEELRGVRAQFIADQAWGAIEEVRNHFVRRDAVLIGSHDYAEVVLWFEHDLYDQLQLLQLLDWFANHPPTTTKLTLVGIAEYLSHQEPADLRHHFSARETVSQSQFDVAQQAWWAFREPNPDGLVKLLAEDISALPFLKAALFRHLQEFPSLKNGLSRSEQQALEVIAAGKNELRQAFLASHHDKEDPVFLGDTVFASYLQRLSRGRSPLLQFADRTPFQAPFLQLDGNFWRRQVTMTQAGSAVLAGEMDALDAIEIDRWLGGVHLCGSKAPWRWDGVAGKLQHVGD